MSVVITIESVDRSSDIEKDSVSYSQTLSKSPATFKFRIKGLKSQPSMGDTIVVTEDSVDIFNGTIVEKHQASIGNVMIGYDYLALDGYYQLDRKLVSKAYNNTTAKALVEDIISTYVTGITVNIPATSPTIKTARFNYEQPSQCIQKIANQIGWDWWIDADLVLHFQPPTANEAPFTITDSNGNAEADSLKFDSNIVELRNIVFVRGGEYLDPITEEDAVDKYESNGEDNTFPLVYRYSNVQITRNGVAQTVGVDYIDSMLGDILSTGTTTGTTANKLVNTGATFVTDGVSIGDQVFNVTDETYAVVTNIDSQTQLSLNKDIMTSGENYNINEIVLNCLYNFQEKLVKFPDGTLDSGDVVRVFGDANVPLIVQAIDSDSIVAYGERESVEIDKTITSIEEAELLANSLLERWRQGSIEGKFVTRTPGLRVGQCVTITSTRFGVDAMYKINKVQGTMKHYDAIEWKIEFLTSGQTKLTDIIISLIGKDKKNVSISPNEVIQIFRQIEDSFSLSDEIVEVTSDSPPYHYGPVSAGNEGLYNFATYT